jgi:hypothetical protein
MFAAIKTVEPFLLVIAEDYTDYVAPLYARIEEHAGYSHLSYWQYSGNITFVEVK